MNLTRLSSGFSLEKLDRLSVFSFMWSIATLFHQLIYFDQWLYTRSLLGTALTISAIMLLIHPRSIFLLIFMLILNILYGIHKLPFLSNHILFHSLIDVLLLISIISGLSINARNEKLSSAITKKDFREQLYDSFAPLARVALFIIYFFGVIHKLNWGFLDPQFSHGAKLLQEMSTLFPFIPVNDATKYFTIWSTLILETAIPFLLCFRRTRNFGIIFSISFHLVLCLNPHRPGFTSFTAMLFGLFILFAPVDFPERLKEWGLKVYQQLKQGQAKGVILFTVMLILFTLIACFTIIYFKSYKSIGTVLLIAYAILFITIFTSVITNTHTFQGSFFSYFTFKWPIQWIGIGLMLFNGFSPYLGLKTAATFNMFTNLRTEGGETNHIFIPLIKLGNYQEDLLEIVETNHPKLLQFAPRKQMITYFEFERILVNEKKDYYVEYIHKGKPNRIEQVAGIVTNNVVLKKYPWWQYKLLGFKPVDYGPHNVH